MLPLRFFFAFARELGQFGVKMLSKSDTIAKYANTASVGVHWEKFCTNWNYFFICCKNAKLLCKEKIMTK